VALVRPADVDGMAAALGAQIERGPAQVDRSAALHELERRQCVAKIAGVLDQVLARARSAAPLAA
jgi:hypothetical protein